MTKKPRQPRAGHSVGYSKPPKHSRFKKGQSGNPKGRLPGRRLAVEKLMELMTSARSPPEVQLKAALAILENSRRA